MSLSYYSMSPEKFPSSAEKNTSPKEAIVQTGEMLWNILQKLGANPTLQTEVTWRRNGQESVLSLSSPEWENLPIGAKVKVENGKISVENPGYSPKSVEKKTVIKESPVSEKQYEAERTKQNNAGRLIDNSTAWEDDADSNKDITTFIDKYANRKRSPEEERLNLMGAEAALDYMSPFINKNNEYLRSLLDNGRSAEALEWFGKELNKWTEENPWTPRMQEISNKQKEFHKKNRENLTTVEEKAKYEISEVFNEIYSLRKVSQGKSPILYELLSVELLDLLNSNQDTIDNKKGEKEENNDILDNDFEQKEREEHDTEILEKISQEEREVVFERTRGTLKEEGYSEKHLAIWKEFCFSEEINEISVGLIERSIKLAKNKEFHEGFQELVTVFFNNNYLEKGKDMSPQEFQNSLNNIIDQVRTFIEEQEIIYNKREANKTKEEEAKENIKQKNADIFIDELLPIPHEKEILWNKYFEEGNMMKLSMDYMDYRTEKLSFDSLSGKAHGAREYLQGLQNESREEALTLDYFLGEAARQKSPILYKIYLIDGHLV